MRAIATAAVGALGLALLGTPGPATAAEKISLRIGAGHPAAATWITTIRELFMPRFAERVKAETEYEIEWTEAWGGSVCKLGECLEAVEAGLPDMADSVDAVRTVQAHGPKLFVFVPSVLGSDTVAELNRRTYEEVPLSSRCSKS